MPKATLPLPYVGMLMGALAGPTVLLRRFLLSAYVFIGTEGLALPLAILSFVPITVGPSRVKHTFPAFKRMSVDLFREAWFSDPI